MEAIKRTVTVSADRELLIKLPENAVPNQTAEVIVLFSPVLGTEEKFALMRDAMADPLFVADLQQVEEDFSLADLDGVEG